MHTLNSKWARGGTLRSVALFAAVAVLAVVLATILPVKADALVGAGLAFAAVIMDSTAEFCDATALSTAGTGLALVGNVMDLTKVRDIAQGKTVYLVISVDTAVTSAGAATVSFILASDAQAAIATDGSATQHYASAAIPKATLVAGYQLIIPLPLEAPAYEEFLGILQNVGTAALTAGKINAYLTLNPPKWKAYPNAVNAS
jgi:hypothetical protein